MYANMKMFLCVLLLGSLKTNAQAKDVDSNISCNRSRCPPGFVATGSCEREIQPACIACPDGTYSAHFSRSSICRNCTKCNDRNEIVLWNCNRLRDTVCVKKRLWHISDIPSGDIQNDDTLFAKKQLWNNSDILTEEMRNDDTEVDELTVHYVNTDNDIQNGEMEFEMPIANTTPTALDDSASAPSIVLLETGNVELDSQDIQDDDNSSKSHYVIYYTAAIVTLILVIVIVIAAVKYLKRSRNTGRDAQKSSDKCVRVHLHHDVSPNSVSGACNVVPQSSVNDRLISDRAQHEVSNIHQSLDRRCQTEITCNEPRSLDHEVHAFPAIFDKSCKIENVNEYRASDAGLSPVSLRNYIGKTSYGLDGMFDIVFDGEFDQDGGVLSHEDSDVNVKIPRGAIPAGLIQKVVVRVSLSHSFFRGSLEKSHIPMTPVVECLAPGLDRFLKHVTVRLPHHVKMTGSNLKFKLHFSQSLPGNRMTWNSMTHTGQKEANNIVNEVHCTLDGKYVNVHTKHFTTFKCSCGKDVPLNLELVAFGEHQVFDKQEVAIKTYICYRTEDYRKRLEINEGKNPRSEYIPLNARHNTESYEITCLGDRGAEDPWTSWKLNDHGGAYPAKQVIELQDIVRHCSDGVPPHRRFVFVPSDDEWKPNFKVLFSVKQPTDEYVNHVPLNMKCGKTIIESITSSSSSSVDSISSDLEFKTQNITKVSSKLKTIAEMKHLLRNLLNDADDLEPSMETIVHDYASQGADEVKYQLLLLWKNRMGMKASVSDLTKALQKCEFNNVVEKLESAV